MFNKNRYNEKMELETYFKGYIDMGNHVEYARSYRSVTIPNITDPGEKRLNYKRAKELIDDEIKKLSLEHIIIDEAQKREKEIREERQRIIDELKKFNDSLDNVSYNLYYIKNY